VLSVRRPRLLVLVTLAEVGGAQTAIALLVPGLVETFDVTVAAYGPGPLREAVEAAGARYVPLSQVRRPLSPRDLLGLAELVRLVRRVRPDVVHTHSSKAGFLGRIAARLAGMRVCLFTAHGWAFEAHTGSTSTLYRYADRLVEPITATVICVAESGRRAGLAAGTCTVERTVVLRNAVPLPELPEPAANGVPTVVSVGRLQEPKDFETLVRALGRLEPGTFRARLVGDGPDREHVQALLDELQLGDAAELVGTSDDVAGILAAADVFVLSSRSEGLPVAILEAMAMALPVVATDVGGIPELVADGQTGLLVPPGDVGALAVALEQLLRDAELRRRLGAAGRARAENEFSVERWREEHVELYRSLLASAGVR
jgi:glycosyltransferase involved in cell wall biosynthesis